MATGHVEAPARTRTTVRLTLAILLGLALAWQVVTAGAAALASQSASVPLLSATGTPSHPDAGALLAQGMLAGGKPAAAASLARSVVRIDPTNVVALRVLGLATIALGHGGQGAAIMRQAATLGWRDTPTQLWMLRDAAVRGDSATVLQRADALARRNAAGELTRAIFLAALTEPHLRGALADRLGQEPMWRGAFFASVRQFLPATSAGSMEALFRDMRARGETIGPIEWLSYVDRLVDLGQYPQARAVWARAFGVPPVRLTTAPYDGDFRAAAARPIDAPSGPFEWTFNPDLASPLTGGAGGAALSISPEIAGGATLASQLLLLPPGTHVLTARIDGPANGAAATWALTCLPSNADLPRQRPSGTVDELSNVTIDVPAQGCTAQRLSLMSLDKPDGQPVTLGDVRIR